MAFAGRSNVGKSSVINRLLGRKNFARVGAAPGKTIHINYFLIDGGFYLWTCQDMGYARVSKSERDRWARLMESYFAHPELMTLGVMIVDSRHNPTADDCTMAQWFRDTGRPMVVVANKLDKLKKSEIVPTSRGSGKPWSWTRRPSLSPFRLRRGPAGRNCCRLSCPAPE